MGVSHVVPHRPAFDCHYDVLRLLAARIEGAEGPPRASSDSAELSGEPSWFPLGGEVYHSQDRFKAEGKPLAFKPESRWFVSLVRSRDPLEGKAAEKQDGSATPGRDHQPPVKAEKAGSGPPLSPPKRLDGLPLVDQGALLCFRVSPAESPDRVRFSLTLKAAERTVWREVEHRWTNTLPLLFAFYADGKAIQRRLTRFEKGAAQDSQPRWPIRGASDCGRCWWT